jgi:hypothetical protein
MRTSTMVIEVHSIRRPWVVRQGREHFDSRRQAAEFIGLCLERPIDRLGIESRIDARMSHTAMVHNNKTPESVPLHLYRYI